MTQKTVTRTTNEVMERMRNWRSVHMAHCAQLFDDVVKEMDRLQKVIDDYVYIAAASAREIKQLRQSYEKSDEKRCDSGTGGVTLTAAEREAVRFFSLIDGPGNVPVANKRAATLRSLLERLK